MFEVSESVDGSNSRLRKPSRHSFIDKSLAMCGDRVFTPQVTIWGGLSQVLSEDHSCRDAVSRIIAHRATNGISICSPNSASYCTARSRLLTSVLSTLARRTAQDLQANHDDLSRVYGKAAISVMQPAALTRTQFPPRILCICRSVVRPPQPAHSGEPGTTCRSSVSGQQLSYHASVSFTVEMASSGHSSRQIMQPLQWSFSTTEMRSRTMLERQSEPHCNSGAHQLPSHILRA